MRPRFRLTLSGRLHAHRSAMVTVESGLSELELISTTSTLFDSVRTFKLVQIILIDVATSQK